MRGWRRVFIAGAVVVCVALGLHAESIADLHPGNYVNDFAHVLSPETETQLDDTCKQIDDNAHAQIAVVTINSLDGRDIDGYAVDLFQKWGIGNKKTNRGVLILVAVKDHRYRTEVGYGLEPILPDGKVGGFGREAVPYFRQNDYDGGIKLMTLRVAGVIADDAGIKLTGAEPPPVRADRPDSGLSPLGVVFIIIVIIVVLATPLRKVLFWWFLLGGGPRGGGWGGGGFGGGGGGGFGGFGGGMSGGGGASGSW